MLSASERTVAAAGLLITRRADSPHPRIMTSVPTDRRVIDSRYAHRPV